MLLTIDIGNSTTCIGLFNVKAVCKPFLLVNPQRISNKKFGDIKSCLPKEKISAVIIASVVPEKNEIFNRVIQGRYDIVPRFVDSSLIEGAYPELGADRVASLIGGGGKFGVPVCVIDCGSATTIDVLENAKSKTQNTKVDGKYGGGIILPGMKMGLKVLHQNTSLLPNVPFDEAIYELLLLGKSTIECIQSGSYWGELCRIQGLIEKIKRKDNQRTTPIKFVCTGGIGNLVAKALGFEYDPWLTLYGLYFIWKKQEAQK